MPAFTAWRLISAQNAWRVSGPPRAVMNTWSDFDSPASAAGGGEPAHDPRHRLLAERHQPLLAALAHHAHDAGIERHLPALQPTSSETRRPVRRGSRASRGRAGERRLRIRRGEERLDLRLGEVLRQAARALRRLDPHRRILAHLAALELQAVEAAHRGEATADRRRLGLRTELVGEPGLDVAAPGGEQEPARAESHLDHARGRGDSCERRGREAVLQPQLVAEGVDQRGIVAHRPEEASESGSDSTFEQVGSDSTFVHLAPFCIHRRRKSSLTPLSSRASSAVAAT